MRFEHGVKEKMMLTFAEWRAQGAPGTFYWRAEPGIPISAIRSASYPDAPEFAETVLGKKGYGMEGYEIESMSVAGVSRNLIGSAGSDLTELLALYGLVDQTVGATDYQELLRQEQREHPS